MSNVHNTGARLLAWVKVHILLLAAVALTLGLVVAIFVTTFRIYDGRRRQAVALCEAANENRESLRGLIVAITAPSLADPSTPPERRELAQRFRDDELAKLPLRDC